MAIALAQDNVASGQRENSSSATLTVTFTKATTAGNHVLLGCCQSAQLALSSISDSRGDTWQVDITETGTGFAASSNIASCRITTAHQINDTLTLTFAGAGLFSAAIVSEWSGLATSSWLDKTAVGEAASGTPTTAATATRSQAAELLFGSLTSASASITAGSGFTQLTQIASGGSGTRNVIPEYKIVAVTGTDAAVWVGSTAYEATLATYKAAVTALSPPFGNIRRTPRRRTVERT